MSDPICFDATVDCITSTIDKDVISISTDSHPPSKTMTAAVRDGQEGEEQFEAVSGAGCLDLESLQMTITLQPNEARYRRMLADRQVKVVVILD